MNKHYLHIVNDESDEGIFYVMKHKIYNNDELIGTADYYVEYEVTDFEYDGNEWATDIKLSVSCDMFLYVSPVDLIKDSIIGEYELNPLIDIHTQCANLLLKKIESNHIMF